MRIGEIKNDLTPVLNSSNELVLSSEPAFGGQAYTISNFGPIMNALNILSEQEWNHLDFGPIAEIRAKFGDNTSTVQVDQQDYRALESYVTQLNSILPVFIGIVDTLITSQDEKVLNIKWPQSIGSLTAFNKLNGRLDKIFKEYDADAKFVGVDTGSAWLVVCIASTAAYHVFIGSLRVAQECFKTKAEYFKAEKIHLDYEYALKLSKKTKHELNFDQYVTERMDMQLERDVKSMLEKTESASGREKPEHVSQIIKATKDLIEILGEGVEFHLSLQPPQYASEENGYLKIDYSAIQKLNEKKQSTKQISVGKAEISKKDPKTK